MKLVEYFSRSYWAKRKLVKLIAPAKKETFLEILTFGNLEKDAQRILVLKNSSSLLRCIILVFSQGTLIGYSRLPMLLNKSQYLRLVGDLQKQFSSPQKTPWEYLDQAFV